MLSYSIVIRTLGKAGEKYQALLDSISAQTIKPLNVYVFIPPQYDLPKEQLGWEKFIRTPKGMLRQRIDGLLYAQNNDEADVILAVDDDVAFPQDYAEKSLSLISKYDADILMPSVWTKGQIKARVVKPWSKTDIFTMLTGARTERRNSPFRISILPTAGFAANSALEGVYPTQSVHFTAFWMKNSLISDLRFDDEYWIEKSGYSLPDDQVFGYKCHINGLKVLGTNKVYHRHLDAGSANPNGIKNSMYAQGRNYLIFWHRFLWKTSKGLIRRSVLLTGISYRLLANALFYSIRKLKKDTATPPLSVYVSGVCDAIKYLRSEEYKNLSSPLIKRD